VLVGGGRARCAAVRASHAEVRPVVLAKLIRPFGHRFPQYAGERGSASSGLAFKDGKVVRLGCDGCPPYHCI